MLALQAGSICRHWHCRMVPTTLMKTQFFSIYRVCRIQNRPCMEYPVFDRFLLRCVTLGDEMYMCAKQVSCICICIAFDLKQRGSHKQMRLLFVT